MQLTPRLEIRKIEAMGQKKKLTPDQIEEMGAAFVVQIIADKWNLFVIRILAEKDELRFNQLHRELDGVSQKVLSQTLKNLENSRIVDRQAFAEVPPRVLYSLSSLGKSLHDALQHLCSWAKDNFDELNEAHAKSKR